MAWIRKLANLCKAALTFTQSCSSLLAKLLRGRGAPDPATVSDDKSLTPLHLSDERQLQVWRALRAKARPSYMLHDWYAGALATLRDESNPDRVAQASHSLRELLEKLPRALQTEVPGPDSNVLKQKRDIAGNLLRRAKSKCPNGWVGETITVELGSALVQFEEYIDLSNWPTRKERAFAGLKKLDPMMQALPNELQEGKWQRYNALWKKVESLTHHRESGTPDDCRDCIFDLESLILDLLAPITADDQDELLRIISKEASVSREEIDRAMSLIGRRGANFAFFFENIRDPVWLEPLDRAGYFNNPPSVAPVGEGMISFPFWWPMAFLKRVATLAPERIVEILLKIDRTDNPRVLDGIVEIAADLPVELAIRLEGKVRDYIKQPYHV